MSTRTRVVGFVVGLAVLFAAAFAVGSLLRDDDPAPPPTYRIELASSNLPAGAEVPLTFTIRDRDGRPVTLFDDRHEKKLHLIAVTKDFSQFRHVHPVMAADGTWTTTVGMVAADWRVFADFQPTGGSNQVVHADAAVTGAEDASGVPAAADLARAEVDGYTVVAQGDLVAGGEGAMLDFEVSRDGRPVTDLEPYLGAYGHLVVLRDSDMEYLHVHPDDGPAGPRIPFHVEVPTPGTYHLYLDFKRDGVVRTAAFTLTAKAPASEPDEMGGMDHGGH